MNKILLTDAEPEYNANSDALAKIITMRLGLLPRKKGSTDHMHKIMLELYERSKKAAREKNPELAVMTVEEMAAFAGITKQTMYEYVDRWLQLEFISKVSYIGSDKKVVKGYKLTGSTLEDAFQKARIVVMKNLDTTQHYILELQKLLKNEKIKASMKKD